NVLAPEWTDYNKHIQYQTFDVTSLLMNTNYTDGTNHAVGMIVGEGWFSGRIANSTYTPNDGGGGPKQALLQLVIERNGLSTTNIVTDDTWKWYNGGPIQGTS